MSQKNSTLGVPLATPVVTASEFKVNEPDWEKARVRALQAVKKAETGDVAAAIPLIEEAIALDSVAALTRFQGLKAEFCATLGQEAPKKALALYSHACHLKRSGRYRDATLAYKEANALDPNFLWPSNNLAWMLATDINPAVRNGPEAVQYASEACAKSNWNCHCFLNTLAAAYAEAGDFDRAIGWQQAALQLAPKDSKLDYELILRHFQLHQAYVDEGLPATGDHSECDQARRHDLLLPTGVSRKVLRELLDDAYLRTEIDPEGMLWILDRFRVIVLPQESGVHITLGAYFQPAERASPEACLQFVNRVNGSIRLVRAVFNSRNTVYFDYEIPVEGGISRRAVVFAVRFFMGAIHESIKKCDTDRVLWGSD